MKSKSISSTGGSFISNYSSPLGEMLFTADNQGLTRLWFVRQDRYARPYDDDSIHDDNNSILVQTKQWLDIYFSGKEPDFVPSLHLTGTPFQMQVWNIISTIPYGQTLTYGDIANRIAMSRPSGRMSAQAVGGAVGSNPVTLIVPCHRVMGANNALTGYGPGLDRKSFLLNLEGIKI